MSLWLPCGLLDSTEPITVTVTGLLLEDKHLLNEGSLVCSVGNAD